MSLRQRQKIQILLRQITGGGGSLAPELGGLRMKTILQTGCLVLAILCIGYYGAIVLYAGWNTSFSWIWLLGSALLLFLWRALIYQAAHPKTWLRYVTGLLGALVILGALLIAVIGSRVVGAMMRRPEQGLEYVIVLGAQVRGTSPSRALRKRLDRAVEYAQENPETIFVLSGGQGPDEEISEAACMYNYMTDKGIDPERLLLEDRSTSTRENLRFSDELYQLKDHTVGVLSNNFHIYRAMAFARSEGYGQVCAIPAPADIGMQPHNMLREICGVIVELIRGGISG